MGADGNPREDTPLPRADKSPVAAVETGRGCPSMNGAIAALRHPVGLPDGFLMRQDKESRISPIHRGMSHGAQARRYPCRGRRRL